MEVKPGSKQTEVGVIPEDWECEKLEEYFSFISYGFTNPMPTVEHGIFMVTAADINEGRIQLDTARKTTEAAYRNLLSPKSKPKKNDILLTKDGSLGRLALVGDEQICINQSVAVIRPNERVEPIFLKLLLESPSYQRKMLEDAGGSTIKHIYITIVNLMPVAIPPSREEQRAIAGALSDVDGLLGGLERLIAKKRDLKQAAMQQLLTGKTRLPGFNGDWELKRIDRIAPLQRGFDLPNSELGPGPYPVVYSNGILNHHSDCKAEGPGVVTGRSGTIGKVTFVEGNYWPHNTSLWVTSFKGNDPKFIFYLYSEIGFERFATGSGVPTLNRNDVHAFEVHIPPTSAEQTAIAEMLSDMDAELWALEQRRETTRDLKQAMMQELLTGKMRLV
jgi:type I restriction enzyme S subunit